jgi:transposase-like protein
MHCPYWMTGDGFKEEGFFSRKTGLKPKVARFYCQRCERSFSENTGSLYAGERRPELDREIYLLVNSGVSQRRIARLLQTTQRTVAKKIVRLARYAEAHQERLRRLSPGLVTNVVFDEMETFEHSKCKPLSIAVAVEDKSRLIISAQVSKMPAKGRLAAIARRRYGYRADHRRRGLAKILTDTAKVTVARPVVKSDQCPRYPHVVQQYLPGAIHKTFKGRRGCVVGQGELKAGGFDPLFSLNHTCAMYRDNLKRLSRRTWCTTKRADRLQALVTLYACAHNDIIRAELYRKRSGLAHLGRPFLALEAHPEMSSSL